MAFFTEEFLAARCAELLAAVATFQYQLDGGDWTDGHVNSKGIVGDAVVVFVNAPGTRSVNDITAVRVLDAAGAVAGQQEVQIERAGTDAALLRFSFPLVEA